MGAPAKLALHYFVKVIVKSTENNNNITNNNNNNAKNDKAHSTFRQQKHHCKYF